MKEIIWRSPSEVPAGKRGDDIKIWGVVDFYRYKGEWGGLGTDGKAERIVTQEKVTRRVVELNYLRAEATDEELAFFEENGDFPEGTPGDLDYWQSEDGDFIGFTGFYSSYPEEGGMYYDEYKMGDNGKLQITSSWTNGQPDRVLLAWAEFEKPEVPENLPV